MAPIRPAIRLTDSRQRRKVVFEPIDPQDVRLYVCGPTVYDRAHLGNARPVAVFDVLFRLLRHLYGVDHVTYVRNFTDVDDKINVRAAGMKAAGDPRALEGIIRTLTDETIGWYHDDMDALGALRPTHEPRATEYIAQMIAMIAELVARGCAYEAAGHVLFRVRSFAGYGVLSGRTLDDMIAGARVEVAPFKEDPLDFVLWKPSDAGLPGWESPWGRGRPGWHIECSAMSHALLGESFDIHGGGIDLQFPHHENEIAQSHCAHPHGGFARYWLHNEMLLVEGKKMSKSLGNFFTVRDLLDQGVPGEVIRFVLLSTHYRKPMDWTARKVEEAAARLDHWHRLTVDLEPSRESGIVPDADVVAALADDLNCHLALHRLSSLEGEPQRLLDTARWLGLLGDKARSDYRKRRARQGFGTSPHTGDPVIDKLLADLAMRLDTLRGEARLTRDFSAADTLKSALLAAGVEVRVGTGGVELLRGAAFDPEKIEALR